MRDQPSFEDVRSWYSELNQMNSASEGVVLVIVGNKSDVAEKRQVATEVCTRAPPPFTKRSFGSMHDRDASTPLSAPSDRWTRPRWAPPLSLSLSLSLCPQDGEDYANSINAIFLEASARTGANVQQIFDLAGALVVAAWSKSLRPGRA